MNQIVMLMKMVESMQCILTAQAGFKFS